MTTRERFGERERHGKAGQGANQQQQSLAQLQTARSATLGGHEKIEGSEANYFGARTANEMDRDRHGNAEQAQQHERRQERHYDTRSGAPAAMLLPPRLRLTRNSISVSSNARSVEAKL